VVAVATDSSPLSLKMTMEESLGVFGHSGFRNRQQDVIEKIIGIPGGLLAVFPTGWGKSLCYQVPALMVDGMSIVVSPLIALMKDQVDKLKDLGVKAELINSSLTQKQYVKVMESVSSGSVDILYVAPERFDNSTFMSEIFGMDIGLFVVDEAHCISRWGHDFRPSYTRLGDVIGRLRPKRVVAFTATATTAVQGDICEQLKVPDAKRVVHGVWRDNLQVAMIPRIGKNRLGTIRILVEEYRRNGVSTGIIYSSTRKEATAICGFLKRNNLKATLYHAGLKQRERDDVQDDWARDGGTIVATCAFGMGIDKADVRFVIHSGLCPSIEDWYQEIGRAGRDGKRSFCLSVWDHCDYEVQKFLIGLLNPDSKEVQKFWEWIRTRASCSGSADDKKVILEMTQKEMSAQSKCASVGACVGILKKVGAVNIVGRGRYEVSLTAPAKFDYAELSKNRNEKIAKLNELVSFFNSRECRGDYICQYFGDESFSPGCGICDRCES